MTLPQHITCVPLYVDIKGGTAIERHGHLATHVLFEAFEGNIANGNTFIAIKSSSIKLNCIYLKKLNITACYLPTEHYLSNSNNCIALGISRVQYGPELAPYGNPTEAETLNHVFHIHGSPKKVINRINYKHKIEDYPLLKSVLAGQRTLTELKVSARHLRHITIKEVNMIPTKQLQDEAGFTFPLLETLIKSDLHESMFCGILVWAMVLPKKEKVLARSSSLWNFPYTSVSHFVKYIKDNFSLRLKAVQNTISTNLAAFFELEVLANRGIGVMDWADERQKRTHPQLATFSRQEIYEGATTIFERIKSKGLAPKPQEWDDFFSRRWQWAPTGSIHSQYEEDHKYFAKDRTLRNKLYSMSRMEKKDFSYFSDRRPECRAWPSIKYEWTKMRAIYGVDLTNFVMSSFGMDGAEELISSEFPIGATAESSMVAASVKEVLRNGVPFCLDFEDFNSQHSISSMQAVLDAYLDCFTTKLSKDQQTAIKWLILSLDETYVKDGDSWYKTSGTLMSGWRLTTFVNTMLNKIYIDLCTPGYRLVADHNGDDVLAAVRSIKQTQDLQVNASLNGVRYQSQKCFLFSICEFLRIDHRGDGSQYLARSVSTFVHGPTETLVPNNLTALLQSNKTRALEMISRGGREEIVNALLSYQTKHISTVWGVSPHDIDVIYKTHLSRGGLSEVISRDSLSHEVLTEEIGSSRSDKAELDANQKFPGAFDYTNRVINTLIPKEYFTKVYNAVKKSVLHNSINKRFSVTVKAAKPDLLATIRAQKYGILRKTVGTNKLELAKSYGIPVFSIRGSEATMLEELMGEVDKLAALKILL